MEFFINLQKKKSLGLVGELSREREREKFLERGWIMDMDVTNYDGARQPHSIKVG